MRLLAERRLWIERACRAGAFAVLALLVVRAFLPPGDAARVTQTVDTSDLARATREEPGVALHFTLEGMPTRTERAWQRAIMNAGSEISWSGALAPIAIAARPVSSPGGGHIVSVSAPPGNPLRLRDDISSIDSVSALNGIASQPVALASGNIRVVAGRDSASVSLSATPSLRRILVLGKAGWETKFLITALEESGWNTDANISVAPNVVVNQGIATIDTARYSAVIALDESAAGRAREIAGFVRSGGGLVLGTAAARSDAFAALRVSQARTIPEVLSTDDSVTHSTAPFSSLQLSSDAVPIERHAGGVSVAARRVGFGRIVQIGYPETWRWRLQGNAVGKTEHGDWWTQVLSQVVYASRSIAAQSYADPAPYADLVDIAGAAVPSVRASAPLTSQSSQVVLVLLLFGLLLTEWASRRLRGAR